MFQAIVKSPLEQGRYVPVFVGGMARSGTTLLSALMSTSSACNPFAPEHHGLGFLAQAISSLTLPDQFLFYRDREEQLRRHFNLFRDILDEGWAALGEPAILVLKHCSLTAVCELVCRFIPQSKFVAIMRNPLNMYSSVSRARRIVSGGRESPSDMETHVVQWIRRFNQSYKAVLTADKAGLSDRILAVNYEAICQGDTKALSQFLHVLDIDPSRLWKRARFDISNYKKDPMYSAGWGKPLNDSYREAPHEIAPQLVERIVEGTQSVRGEFIALASKTPVPTPNTIEPAEVD